MWCVLSVLMKIGRTILGIWCVITANSENSVTRIHLCIVMCLKTRLMVHMVIPEDGDMFAIYHVL